MPTPDASLAADARAIPATMRAAICTAYGPPEVVRLAEVPTPRPGAREVLVRVAAATVSAADWRIRAFAMPTGFGLPSRLAFGFRRPRQPILGTELSGTVVAVGEAATRFRPGDEVIAYLGASLGSHAEYRAVPETAAIVPKPPELGFIEAAALSFGGSTALHFLRDRGHLGAGDRVLVIGASGSVGSAAVALASHMGADVTGATSAANLELVRSVGAHAAIDYATGDHLRPAHRYDIILDAVGALTFAEARAALAPDGRLLMVSATLPQMLRALATLPRRRKAIPSFAPERRDDVACLADLARRGVVRPLIDAVYPFDRITNAHHRVESRRKRGNVVLAIDPSLES
jgi:NADPH:quinone reductase-like Zn-dependent oxidoreductase